MSSVKFYNVGSISFKAMRLLQDEYVSLRVKGLLSDVVFFCEHPPTISLGKRAEKSDLLHTEEELINKGYDVVSANRGGSVTYHGPGQLVIYPVIKLSDYKMGVKDFCCEMLNTFSRVLDNFNVQTKASFDPVGLWLVNDSNTKIAAAGLRIEHGVSNHGFSLNVYGDLKGFSEINSCGDSSTKTGTVSEEAGSQVLVGEVVDCLKKELSLKFQL